MKKILLFVLLIFLSFNSYSENKGYYLCLGSFNNKAKFLLYYKKLKADGINLVAERIYDHGKIYYQMHYRKKFYSHEKAKEAIPRFEKYRQTLLFEGTDIWIKYGIIKPYDPFAGEMSLADYGDEFVYYRPDKKFNGTVICETGAGQLKKNDSADSTSSAKSFALIQVSPEGGKVIEGTPVVFFFNSDIFLPSLIDNLTVTRKGESVRFTARIFRYNSECSALSIALCGSGSSEEEKISITISGGLSDSTGKTLGRDITAEHISIKKDSLDEIDMRNINSLENAFKHSGDSAVLKLDNSIVGTNRENPVLFLTNSDKLVSKGSAIGKKYSSASTIVSRIPSEFKFDFNFISSEFNEFNSNKYSDIALLTIAGDSYQKTFVVASPYIYKEKNKPLPYKKFLNLPDEGDVYAGQTEWLSFTAGKIRMSGKAVITFSIIDLVESSQSSVIMIRDIR